MDEQRASAKSSAPKPGRYSAKVQGSALSSRVGMALLACTTLLAASYSRPAVLPRHSPIAASATAENAFSLLDGVKVLHVSDGAEVALNQQWKDDERCALFFFRSFG